jgi:hypothetical protein
MPSSMITIIRRSLWILVLCVLPVTLQTGCVNTMVMMSKVLLGDPVQISAFQQGTGVNLAKEKKQVLIRVSAPALVEEEFARLTTDVEEELIRRMRRHKIQVMHPDTAARVLDRLGGAFDPQVLAREVEGCDYIMHIKLDTFSLFEGNSTNFYRGNATGAITAYEIRRDGASPHAVQVYEQRFSSSYPTTYPVSVDSTPRNVFMRRFIDRLADNLGNAFYDVNRSELYAN